MNNAYGSKTLLIDLGTTTIAYAIVSNGISLDAAKTHTFANPERVYGEDVISRMEASMSGKRDEIQKCITDSLKNELIKMCDTVHSSVSDIDRILIGGNTTMIHLLMGYDCTPLSRAPFKPSAESPADPDITAIPGLSDTSTTIIPWASAFIGGDIIAGLSSVELKPNTLFIDLGTNGEMVLCRSDGELFATATAAGPALEGGGLSCGAAAIPGAISDIELYPLSPRLTTIGNKTPIGLCGSGAISLTAELIRKGYVDADTTLTDKFPAEGISLVGTHPAADSSLVFTADDLHRVLLAKAAVAAGIDTLLKASGIKSDDVDTVYLAGGLGFFIEPDDAAVLGIFSDIDIHKVVPVGNACLAGLYAIANTNKNGHDDTQIVVPDMHIINLGTSDYFKEKYIERLSLR